jgi:hypothetical protein
MPCVSVRNTGLIIESGTEYQTYQGNYQLRRELMALVVTVVIDELRAGGRTSSNIVFLVLAFI